MLYKFINSDKIFTAKQGSFCPSLGINNTIISALEYINNGLNNKEDTIAILSDLKKAFDTINHGILFAKLEGAGIKFLCLKLLIDYIFNRRQQCKFNGSISDVNNIECGVPQGSTLRPLLFIIYVNDGVNHVKGASRHFM